MAGFPPPVQNHLQRFIGDDWIVPVAVASAANVPVNLTGYQLFCAFYGTASNSPTVFSVAAGYLTMTNAAGGLLSVQVPASLTSACIPLYEQLALGLSYPRGVFYWIDPLGLRQTLGVVYFDVFDGSEDIAIVDQSGVKIAWQDAQFTLNVAAAQGPSGPSTINVAAILDASTIGRQVLQANSAAAILALIGAWGGVVRHVNDANYTVVPGDNLICFDKLTATRTVTLCQPATFGPARTLTVMDGSGSCSPATSIHLVPPSLPPPTNCTIKGASSEDMQGAFDCLTLRHNDSNLWVF